MITDRKGKLEAAKQSLTGDLDDIFFRSSVRCRQELDRAASLISTDDEPIIADAVYTLRDNSLDCIQDAYARIHHCLGDDASISADCRPVKAKSVVWEVIDNFFYWTPEDKTRATRFEEWQSRIGATSWNGKLLLKSPQCAQGAILAEQLRCDFYTHFEALLDRLTNRTACEVHITTADLGQRPGKQLEIETQLNLAKQSKDCEERGVARAQLVQYVTDELHWIKSELNSTTLEDLVQHNPDSHILKVCLERPHLHKSLLALTNPKTQQLSLACEIVGALLSRSAYTIETAWKRYRKLLESSPH